MHDTTTSAYFALQLWIGGHWRDASDFAYEPIVNPASGQPLGKLPLASAADVDEALAAAAAAFQTWRRTGPLERGAVLRRAAALLRERREALARLICLELGKPVAEARREIEKSAQTFEWSAEECRRAYGRLIPPRIAGHQLLAVPEPVGPVAAFTSWNAPVIGPVRKLSAAIAAGCSVILKPAESTPACSLFVGRILAEAGLPAGVANILLGDPAAISDRLLHSPIIRMVTFTGSVEVGKRLAALAAQGMKRMVFELGGHAPVIVAADADVEETARGGVAAKLRNSGQNCTAPTRFLVHRSIYSRFVERYVEQTRQWRVGDPLDEATQMGPLQNPRRLAAMESLVADAQAHGARLVHGGSRIDAPGFFYQPTVLTEVSPACRAANVEPFGPLSLITPFDELDEAIAEANRLPLALAAYLFSHDLRVVERVSSQVNCGNLVINHWNVSQPETPFGGVQDSGMGSEGGIEGLQAFQQIKFINQAP